MLARFSDRWVSELSPLSGAKRKLDFRAVRTAFVKVCGWRPHDGGAADRHEGPAYANLQRRKAREV